MKAMKLWALASLAVLALAGCEVEKDPSATPPPQPQPPADLASSDPANPTPDRLIFSSGNDEPDLEVYTSFADGSGRVRLTRNLEGDSGAVHYPSTGLVYYVCGRSESVCVANTAGTGTAGVFSSQRQGFAIIEDPDISPDGSKMLWTAVKISPDGSSTNYDIYMYDFATETSTGFAVGAAQDQMPKWVSNDQVVWSRLRNGDWDLVTFKLGSPAGSNPTVLTDNDVDDLGVDVSADATKLAWIGAGITRDTQNDGQLFTMPFSPTGGQTATPLTSVRLERGFIGGDPDVAWSPDGSRIAYAGIPDGEDDVEIFTIPASGGSPTNVTKNSVYDVDPDWALIPPTVSVGSPLVKTEGSSGAIVFDIRLDAPQSETVTVQFTTEPGTATTADFTPVSGTATFTPGQTVVRVSVTVKDDTALEPTESFKFRIFNTSAGTLTGDDEARGLIVDDEVEPTPTRTATPTPTPTSTVTPGPTAQAIAYESSGSIWLVNPDGTNPRQVQASGSSPDIHPDGTKIAFGHPPGSFDIYTAPINGGTPTKVPGSTPDSDNSPQWSTDGSGLLWTTAGQSFNTYVADPYTETTPVVFPEGVYFADWGRVNGSEVIVAVDGTTGMIGLYDPTTGNRIGDPIVEGIAPEISPDGTKLAYASDLHGDMDIFVLDLTDPNATALHLTTSSATDSNPTWSPDNLWIAFSTNRTGTDNDIYKMRPHLPDSETAVVATDAHETWPSWGRAVSTTTRADVPDAPTVPSDEPSPAPTGSFLVLVPVGALLASAVRHRRR